MLNELGELNLLILEKMYNTFESKADKVFFYFWKEKFAYLRPWLFKYVGDLPQDKGKGVDNANDETFVLDGDNEAKNLFRSEGIEGDENAALLNL